MAAVYNLTGSKTIASVSDLKHLQCAWGSKIPQAIMEYLRRSRISPLPTNILAKPPKNMFPPNLFFSILTFFLSAAALGPASENPNTETPSPAYHAAERDLLVAPNPQNVTDLPLTTPPSTLNTTSNDIPYTCFTPDPHSPRITPTDCHTALYNLLAAPDALALKHYDRTSDLPVENNFRSCSIILTRSSARSDGIFQPVLIAHAAALVTKNCVTQQFGFQGGYARIGTGIGFLVYVSASGDPRDGPSAAA